LIANASPSFLGMTGFDQLEQRVDHARTLEQLNYLPWRRLRETEDARFIGLALPRVVLRVPYADDGTRIDGFCFREDVSGLNTDKYLWGGAAFAWGEVLMRAFAQAGWLADIRGVKRDEERGGLVARLPVCEFHTDALGVAQKGSTEVMISDQLERQLSELGFIPLCPCKDTEYSAFFSNQSIQKPKRYDDPVATTNAQISSMLQYMFCVSRFAHYIKVMGRDKTGTFATPDEFEDFLQRWVSGYVTADTDASAEVKSRHPLRAAQVKVFPEPGKPGAYNCVMHLAPHYELDELSATVRLQAELTPARTP
jgi:type VI secretion system ImpC/EvpB family protein